ERAGQRGARKRREPQAQPADRHDAAGPRAGVPARIDIQRGQPQFRRRAAVVPSAVLRANVINTSSCATSLLRLLVLLLVMALLAGGGGCVLYPQLNETQANEVLAELIDHGVDARKDEDKRGDGWQVLVNGGDMRPAMAIPHNAGRPHTTL